MSSEITVKTIENTINTEFGVLDLGGVMNGETYGQEIAFLFYNDTLEYGIEAESELISLLALSDVVALKVIGIKDGSEYEFEQSIDWTTPYYPSMDLHNASIVEFIGANRPDEGRKNLPEGNKDAYTIFDTNQLGFLTNLIPLMKNSHISIENFLFSGLTIENQLAVARFLHLYELIQKPYEAGKDYYAEFLSEFNTKNAIVYEGNELWNRKLWDNFFQEDIEEYIKSWKYMKENPSESIFDDNKFFSECYPKWYYNAFKPNLNDYYQFLQKSPLTKLPDFWYWYMNTYLREDFHPFSDDSFS